MRAIMRNAMADLSAKERAALPDSAFAYIDSAGRRRLPIHDEAHVRNALGRFNRVLFDDEAARDQARTRLLRAAKRYNLVPVGFIAGQLRPKLPTGQLTLLFADIEGSSRLVAELDDRYGPVLSAVRRIERAALREHAGHEVDARADELFAVFTEADDALATAVAIIRGVEAHDWPDGRRVRVRIGLHTGRPSPSTGGYQGLAVNTAARLCACGHGGQILVSRTTRAALRGEPAPSFKPLGAHRLRGIPDAVEIHQVLGDGLPSRFRALRLG
jgi:class 3 adenylate cyclase